MTEDTHKILTQIKFNANDLVPVIVQDYKNNDILMFAWMNKEALTLTIEKKIAFYYSRSRQKLWQKGEQSGYSQEVKEIFTDCDNDVILLKVAQKGGISCHTGRKSCFFNKLVDSKWKIIADVIKNPEDIYHT